MGPLSVFDLFKIGVGPSSSHTLGPWRAAGRFVDSCRERGYFPRIDRVRVDLFGSLAKTGKGHGTDVAVMMGLAGEDPVTCDTGRLHEKIAAIRNSRRLRLDGARDIPFDPDADLLFHRDLALPAHPNALRLTGVLADGAEHAETYYSTGGGFVEREGDRGGSGARAEPPLPFITAAELLARCADEELSIPEVARRDEATWNPPEGLAAGLRAIWDAMRACIWRGCHARGVLPGGLEVVRRAARMHDRLLAATDDGTIDGWTGAVGASGGDFRRILEWVSCFALAVNEENAAFGRVVTAPTNGSAGVVPAVLMYHACFGGGNGAEIEDFLLTAGAIGALFKNGATISAAQGGCQAEIGVSSAMAAAGLCQVQGGSPARVLMAAEIAMEHHLGLTCDPIAGLVQVPCIERNTMGAVKAITACQLALAGDPAAAKVPLDAVIRTMWATAQDMSTKYKETAEGGLAVLVPVNVIEC